MNKAKLQELYKKMLVIRHTDEMFYELKMKDLIMDGFHPYSGQEAVAVGISSVLNPTDAVVSNHRPQGHSIAKGSTPRSVFAEMLGRRGGVSNGIGGPMQWIDAPNLFYCGSIVGSGVTIAAGIALAMKKEGKGRICACYFGDGASNTGAFHEGMNLASIWKLPVLYVCENNQYGEAMPVREFVSCHPISKRAESYSMPGVTVDGMDINAVVAAAEEAAEYVRGGKGPYFIETVTYRFRGHYGGDPEHTYRTKEEVARWRIKDPIARAKAELIDLGITEAELTKMEKAIVDSLKKDQEWALAQPFPTVEQATDNVMIPLA
jgi:TPP-dependent pyruvate/acetoin dehydrogenase alpha subunit